MIEFNHQTRIISGEGSIEKIGQEVVSLGVKKVLIVLDPYFEGSSFLNLLEQALDSFSISFLLYSKISPNPKDIDVDSGVALAKENGVEAIIALGGGSAIDQGKAIALIVRNGGKCNEWHNKNFKVKMLPTICIPTTAGTGSEVTYISVIDDTENHFKMTIGDPINGTPVIAILDPNLTLTLPGEMTSGPGIDVLTHAIEAYTSKAQNDITDCLALKAIEIVKDNLHVAYKEPDNINARSNMSLAASIAGIAFINSNVGAVHALSETIGAIYDLPHGLVNAILLVPTIEYNLDANYDRYADIALALGANGVNKSNQELAEEGVVILKKYIEQFKLPSFSNLNKFSESDFENLAIKAMKNDLVNDNVKKMTVPAFITILEKSF